MSKENKSNDAVQTLLLGLLLLVFITLKLCHVIEWSWWWVMSPLWIPVAFGLVCALLYFIILCFCAFRK